MKTYEFPLKLTSDGRLDIPGDVSAQLAGQPGGRVVIMIPDASDAQRSEWQLLTYQRLSAAYGLEDAIYDDDGPAPESG